MKVILLKTVPKLGKKDDVVDVAQGFAQNALFPHKLAVAATPAALAALKRDRDNKVTEHAIRRHLLEQALKELGDREVVLRVKANEGGQLFSKVHEADIARLLSEEHMLFIDPVHIVFPAEIKKTGTYTITLKEGDYIAPLQITILPQ